MSDFPHVFRSLPSNSFLNKRKALTVSVFTEGMDKNTYAYPSLKAFAEGVAASGDKVQLVEKLKYEPCDVAVIFGEVREGKGKEKRMPFKAEIKGRHIHRGLIVIDTAILTRSSPVGSLYRRIGIDGLLRDEADFNNVQCPPDRWEKLSSHAGIALPPWRDHGEHILIALQRPLDASLKSSAAQRPFKYREWLINAVKTIRENSDRPIHVRPHPGSLGQDWEMDWLSSVRQELQNHIIWDDSPKTFAETMENCWTCVTYNSGAGVDAALSGIPVISCDGGSFAWDISGHDLKNIEKRFCPDRSQWLNNLSYVEWSLEEISLGLPWWHLKNKIVNIT